MRIEIILDIGASEGLSLTAPWQVLVDGKRTDPPLMTPEELIGRLASLGIDSHEAQFHAHCLTHSTPYYQFELPASSAPS